MLDRASYGSIVFETALIKAFLTEAAKLNRHANRRVDLSVANDTLRFKAHDETFELNHVAAHTADFALAFPSLNDLHGVPYVELATAA